MQTNLWPIRRNYPWRKMHWNNQDYTFSSTAFFRFCLFWWARSHLENRLHQNMHSFSYLRICFVCSTQFSFAFEIHPSFICFICNPPSPFKNAQCTFLSQLKDLRETPYFIALWFFLIFICVRNKLSISIESSEKCQKCHFLMALASLQLKSQTT